MCKKKTFIKDDVEKELNRSLKRLGLKQKLATALIVTHAQYDDTYHPETGEKYEFNIDRINDKIEEMLRDKKSKSHKKEQTF